MINVEDVNKKILGKLAACTAAYTAIAERRPSTALETIKAELDTVERSYYLITASVLSKYYNSENDHRIAKQYYRIISGSNIINSINSILEKLIVAIRPLPLTQIARTLNNARMSAVTLDVKKREQETCKCGARMNVRPSASEMICSNELCGRIEPLIGTVFHNEDTGQHDIRPKPSGYDTLRHFKFWIERLQAIEQKEFLPRDLARIEAVLNRDGYRRELLTCKNIRAVLKELKLTSLNDHTPLIVKTMGGVPPPMLTFQQSKRLETLFELVMRTYTRVVTTEGNKPYYPYFIYKIIESEFGNTEIARLLNYIHLQSRDTVIKNDNTYARICAEIPGNVLTYRPTDPARQF